MSCLHTVFLALSLAGTSAAAALAHVGLDQPEAQRGKSYKAVFKVPHGCEGSATHTVRVVFPEGFIGAKPMPKAGWTIKTVRGAYAREYGYFHGPLKEGVKEIEWSGGSLPNDYYDEFVAAGFVAKELDADRLYFKVTQLCDKGELNWVEIPDKGVSPHDLAAPAAVLKLVNAAAAADDGHAHHGHSAKAANEGIIGTIKVEGAWTRATADGAKVGAGYLTLTNEGPEADVLVAVETDIAGKSEVHDMTMSDQGVMQMRRMDSLELPAGGSVALKPGGMHLMFLDLKQPLTAGATLKVKLTFKSGASGEVSLPVRPIGGDADPKAHDHSHH